MTVKLAKSRLKDGPIEPNETNEPTLSLSDTDEGGEVAATSATASTAATSAMEMDRFSRFVICDTIDESMLGLHSLYDLHSHQQHNGNGNGNQRHSLSLKPMNCSLGSNDNYDDYDWILDGDPHEEHDNTNNDDARGRGFDIGNASNNANENIDDENFKKRKRRRRYGDEALDQMLGLMEMEDPSFSTASSICSICSTDSNHSSNSISGMDNGSNGKNDSNDSANNDMQDDEKVNDPAQPAESGVSNFANFANFESGFSDNSDHSDDRLHEHGEGIVSVTAGHDEEGEEEEEEEEAEYRQNMGGFLSVDIFVPKHVRSTDAVVVVGDAGNTGDAGDTKDAPLNSHDGDDNSVASHSVVDGSGAIHDEYETTETAENENNTSTNDLKATKLNVANKLPQSRMETREIKSSTNSNGNSNVNSNGDSNGNSNGYLPPQSIEQLVTDLDAQLNTTIEECYAVSNDSNEENEANGANESNELEDMLVERNMEQVEHFEPFDHGNNSDNAEVDATVDATVDAKVNAAGGQCHEHGDSATNVSGARDTNGSRDSSVASDSSDAHIPAFQANPTNTTNLTPQIHPENPSSVADPSMLMSAMLLQTLPIPALPTLSPIPIPTQSTHSTDVADSLDLDPIDPLVASFTRRIQQTHQKQLREIKKIPTNADPTNQAAQTNRATQTTRAIVSTVPADVAEGTDVSVGNDDDSDDCDDSLEKRLADTIHSHYFCNERDGSGASDDSDGKDKLDGSDNRDNRDDRDNRGNMNNRNGGYGSADDADKNDDGAISNRRDSRDNRDRNEREESEEGMKVIAHKKEENSCCSDSSGGSSSGSSDGSSYSSHCRDSRDSYDSKDGNGSNGSKSSNCSNESKERENVKESADSQNSEDSDYYDPVVLDEILNVPWPFHQIHDLDESFFVAEEEHMMHLMPMMPMTLEHECHDVDGAAGNDGNEDGNESDGSERSVDNNNDNPSDDDDAHDSQHEPNIPNASNTPNISNANQPNIHNIHNMHNAHNMHELTFDNYLINRLSQLDSAKNLVMKQLFSRAIRNKDAIEKGTQRILGAELDVAAAVVCVDSSREFLRGAIGGYPLVMEDGDSGECVGGGSGGGHPQTARKYNPILGGLKVLDYADQKDRLLDLQEILDRISVIQEREARWWRCIPTHKHSKLNSGHTLGMETTTTACTSFLPPQDYEELVNEAKILKDMTYHEEILHHIPSLHSMRDRMQNLDAVLRDCIEESLAILIGQILEKENGCETDFEQHFLEYECLLRSWVSTCELSLMPMMPVDSNKSKHDAAKDSMERFKAIASEWSGSILKIVCFEISKAVPRSLMDSCRDDSSKSSKPSTSFSAESSFNGLDFEGIESRIRNIGFNSNYEEEFQDVTHEILDGIDDSSVRANVVAFAFFHQCSRLVEIMNFYGVVLQWQESILVTIADQGNGPDFPESAIADEANIDNTCLDSSQPKEGNEAKIDPSIISSMSADKSSCQSLSDDDDGETSHLSLRSVPKSFDLSIPLHPSNVESFSSALQRIHQSAKSILHPVWKYCESILVHFVEYHMSCSGEGSNSSVNIGADCNLETLGMTYTVFLQFETFSKYFLNYEDEDGDDECHTLCNSIEAELVNIYKAHLRNIQVEAMKTTGTLLRHDSWQLMQFEFPGGEENEEIEQSDEKKCVSEYSEQCADEKRNDRIMRSMYEAVGKLLTGFGINDKHSESKASIDINSKSIDKGYKYSNSFSTFTQRYPSSKNQEEYTPTWRVNHLCTSIEVFNSSILPYIERKPCGLWTCSLLTQSSANGLVKWTPRLLQIGYVLPLIANDASVAIITLFDLYILTVFRFCAVNKLNENVLMGLGRCVPAGTAPDSSNLEKTPPRSKSKTALNVSLTMEADVCAPLPREVEDYEPLRTFICNGRRRLENIVNLDKFESVYDMCVESPNRSKNDIRCVATRLEKQSCAAHSCLFAAVLIDVASSMLNDPSQNVAGPLDGSADEDITLGEDSLVSYAKESLAMVPLLVNQSCRISCVYSISGKELIFQVMMVGRQWEEHNLNEHSNAYVDDLCDRCTSLWGLLNSSMGLPTPALNFTWEQLVKVAFLSLLEGFSKISNCSLEGRSLMSMDLATLSHNLTGDVVMEKFSEGYPMMSSPPDSCRIEVMSYVDTFVKVFYFPSKDIHTWIEENSKDYHIEHTVALMPVKSASEHEGKSMWNIGKQSFQKVYNNMYL